IIDEKIDLPLVYPRSARTDKEFDFELNPVVQLQQEPGVEFVQAKLPGALVVRELAIGAEDLAIDAQRGLIDPARQGAFLQSLQQPGPIALHGIEVF